MKPARLRRGGVIHVVAPSSPPTVPMYRVAEAIDMLRSRGYRVTLGDSVKALDPYTYRAAKPEVRARDINEAYRDPDVDVIVSVTGGAGALDILEHLDYDLIKENPKVLVGYSDVTAIQNAIYARTGVPSLHAVMLQPRPGEPGGYSRDLETALRILEGDMVEYTLRGYARVMRGGLGEGFIVGGNLTMFTLLAASGMLPDIDGGVMFFEDVNERGYKIGNMLQALRLRGLLDRTNGILLGEFSNTEDENWVVNLAVHSVISETRAKPVLIGFPCCHGWRTYPLPIGSRVKIDGEELTVSMIEPLTE